MNKFYRFLRYILAWVLTSCIPKKIQSNKDKVRKIELALIKKFPTPQIGPFIDHDGYQKHIQKCQKKFIKYIKSDQKNDSVKLISIGDSIVASCINWLFSIRPRLNFNLGGMWIHHMKKLFEYLVELFKKYNFIPDIIVLGTPGGNNFLNRQELQTTLKQFQDLFYYIRSTYPRVKIIIHNLPASIVGYVISVRPQVEKFVVDLIKKDSNSVFLKLEKDFVENKHALPKADKAADGVHPTWLGMILIDDRILEGTQADPGTVIN